MRRIRTTPRCWIGAPLLFAAWPLAGCVLSTNGGTTDVALESGGSSEDPSTGPASDADSSGDASSGGDDDTSSGGGESTGSDSGDDTTTTGSGDPSTGEPNLCGNGAIDPGEECDGAALAVDSCAEVDAIYTDGEPSCDAACKLDISGCQACEAPAIVPCDDQSDAFLNALELGCDVIDGFDATNAVPVDMGNSLITSPDVEAHRVLKQFGSDPATWAPRAGTKALLISTGGLAPANDQGALVMPPGSAQNGLKNFNGNPDGGLPGDLHVKMQDGGDPAFTGCDGTNDCSNTLSEQWVEGNPTSVYDVLSMTLTLAVPAGTHGFALDLAYFTAHFPEHNNTYYNDVTVIWAQSERYVGNISYIQDAKGARPMSLPVLAKAGWMTHDGATDPLLAGTGYDGPAGTQGGATDWLTVSGPAVPGETLVLEVTVFDFQDMFRDTALLLDNFRWSCAGCEPGVDCGVTLAQ
jgi:hypothetical protein